MGPKFTHGFDSAEVAAERDLCDQSRLTSTKIN